MKALLALVLMFISIAVVGQIKADELEPNQNVLIKLETGDEYRGEVVEVDEETVLIRSEVGEFSINKSSIKRIWLDDYEGNYAFTNRSDTRYFFGPSAIPIGKGEGYYQNILLSSNFFNYGVAENFSVGGGFEFISTMSGTPVWFFTPKLGFEIANNNYIGASAFVIGVEDMTASLLYGTYTYGTSDGNVSLGLGYGMAGGELSSSPVFMLSGMQRLSNRLMVVSENYVFSSEWFGIQGLRIIGRKTSFDFGVMMSAYGVAEIPFVGMIIIF